MSDYTVIASVWNGGGALPARVTGTAFSGGMTTAQKFAAMAAWTVPAPAQKMIIPGSAIYAVLNYAEFVALTAAQQQLVRDVFVQPAVDCSAGTMARTALLAIFGAGTTTRGNLVALAGQYDSPTQPWATAPVASGGAGLATFSMQDVLNAGLS